MLETRHGKVAVLPREALFARLAETVNEAVAGGEGARSVALTGGSTPKAWYRWSVERGALSPAARSRVLWTVSDERHVALADAASNFGNAARLLLDPLEIGDGLRAPWPVELDPQSAAAAYRESWARRRGDHKVYDLCVLGMGDDCHTASLFPDSPLVSGDPEEAFAAVEVPGKGWRLTVTPAGLRGCGRIAVIVTGAGKADALAAVFGEAPDPVLRPVQLLAEVADRVTWLVDPAAAEKAFGGRV